MRIALAALRGAGLLVLAVVLALSGCDRKPDASAPSATASPGAGSAPAAPPPPPPKTYAYGDWSDWAMECRQRMTDQTSPCTAIRKRICLVEGTTEGVACEHCGGQCKEVVSDATSAPLHIYTPWSSWESNCKQCDPEPQACSAKRSRQCLDRLVGGVTDCEFCGGACSETEPRQSSCSPDCKWTTIHAYSDDKCTIPVKGDMFAGQWGPQTGSPYNAGCSETEWNRQCVKFGSNHYQWEPCVKSCTAPMTK